MDNKVIFPYSQAEERLLGILKKQKGRVDSITLHDLFYGGQQQSFYSQTIVNSALRSLRIKADHNDEPFMIGKSKKNGPRPMQFWIEERPSKKKKKAKTGVK